MVGYTTHIHRKVPMYVCIYIYTYIHTYIYIYIDIYIYIERDVDIHDTMHPYSTYYVNSVNKIIYSN